MYKLKKKRKAIMLSLGLAIAMLPAPSVRAQGVLGDLLDDYYAEQDQQSKYGGGVMGRGISSDYNIDIEDFGSTPEGNINVEDFGTPAGSGTFILMAVGASYAIMKRRKHETSTSRNN